VNFFLELLLNLKDSLLVYTSSALFTLYYRTYVRISLSAFGLDHGSHLLELFNLTRYAFLLLLDLVQPAVNYTAALSGCPLCEVACA
jgi:hypothetical protein